MASKELRIPPVVTFCGVEHPKRLLRLVTRSSPNIGYDTGDEMQADELAQPPNIVNDRGTDNFQAIADQVVSEERLAYFEATLVTHT